MREKIEPSTGHLALFQRGKLASLTPVPSIYHTCVNHGVERQLLPEQREGFKQAKWISCAIQFNQQQIPFPLGRSPAEQH